MSKLAWKRFWMIIFAPAYLILIAFGTVMLIFWLLVVDLVSIFEAAEDATKILINEWNKP